MAGAVIGALRVNLGIDSAQFQEGLKNAQAALGNAGKSMQLVGKSLSTYLTVPLAGAGAAILNTAGSFEASMNRVQAATNASTAEFDAMKKMALDLGANTSKSASESADMMEMLAKNGLTAQQILAGAASASIKLSEATGGDLSTAADVATNVMSQFKIGAEDLGEVVDGITNVTLTSQFGFNDYKDAIAQAGGIAGALGVKFQDFNAAIAGTSSVFNSGADAGTSFKTFLTTLVPKSKAAREQMDALGLKFFDAGGKMKSIADIAENLKTSLSGLSDEAKNDAVTTIFGSDAMRTALALADQGAEGINKLAASIQRQGSANEQAQARMKGFNGELEKLGGSLETLANKIADAGLLQWATQVVSKMSEFVDRLGQTNPELLKWGTIVAASAAAIGPLVIAVGAVAAGIAAIGAPIAVTVAGFAALAAGAAALYANWDQVKASFPTTAAVIEKAIAVIETTATGLMTQLGLVGQYLGQFLTGNLTAAGETVRQIFANLGSMFTDLANIIFPGAGDAIKAKIAEVVSSVTNFISSMMATFQAIPGQMAAIAEEIAASFAALPGRMLEIGGQIVDGLVNGIQAKWEAAKGAITGIADSITNSVKATLGIHSPSRVMHEIGEFIMQGLQNGMAAGTPNAVSEAGKAAQAVSAQLATAGAAGGGAVSGVETATDAAADGLSKMESVGQQMAQTLGNAFTGLINGSKKLKDVALDALSSIGRSLLNSGLQALFGGGGSGAAGASSAGGGFGSIIAQAIGSLIGFSQGGSIMPGGAANGTGIDSQTVAFRKKPSERVDIYEPGKMKSSSALSVRGGDIIIQGDVSERNLQAIRDAIAENNERLPDMIADHDRNPRMRRRFV
ncbi:phage tail tape measure protein [Rhizobium rhizosphaerae]|uniref:Phage tail tape measure protein n=1 Tax=Xaviernesmea rhizosphaerae TaxID=1672749 RepID=A0A1Q9AMT2_9HYPH|nr:phage tail tape measure protein [Xaviernesmea rhizosphaerae]OLP56673.1 phage tail tape measure protein [Xaviernesmea rhizosphaerae]